ncbi:MAG: putative geopeptide radical SAM maturase [Deltaproteobacteria bacterium]|nr:putative geopeptide radical SAM maturase [Deltaproteobacteria bacterium]
MHLSRYLKIYLCEDKPGHVLLFSTRQISLVQLPQETLRKLRNGDVSPDTADTLARLGMLVADRDKEKRDVCGLRDPKQTRSDTLRLIVVLNLDCNFACPYCFEGDLKGERYMADETARGLVAFIKDRITAETKNILVDFYGGEPLLSTGQIGSVSRALQAVAAEQNLTYTFGLVSNGSLFRRSVAEELVALGLKNIQITLDGPRDLHDRSRPFTTGAGSFDVIVENIKATCDLVGVSIGGNFSEETYPEFVRLLDCLEAEGLTPDKIAGVKFAPVTGRPQRNGGPADFAVCMSINEPWLQVAEKLLRAEILKRGYYTPKPSPLPCMVDVEDALVVNYDGTLYKCPAFIGNEAYAVGDLQTGVRDYRAAYNLDLWKNDTCMECDYLPLCFGGCRYMTFIRNGDITTPDCKKPYLDASLETLIKQDLKCRPKPG